MNKLTIENVTYEVIDTLEYVTLADSFVRNKIGSGHGEAKLYVGNESKSLNDFFEDYQMKCFFRKSDFKQYLDEAKMEFLEPQQKYIKKDEMPQIYEQLKFAKDCFEQEILEFEAYRVDVEPPRVYVNSKSVYYEYMRNLGLPNISYLSILKLKEEQNNCVLYYFKIFVDSESELVTYAMKKEEEQEKKIEENDLLSDKTKNKLINSRIGQGDYRKKLLKESPFCPFTMISDERLLVASHIKPWVLSDDYEKVDSKNGFLFTPTYDRLFNKGFISFEDDKTLLVSPWISPMNQKRLGIYTGKIIENLPLDEKRKKYLKFHREYIFKY